MSNSRDQSPEPDSDKMLAYLDFAIRGEHLDPDEITRLMGVQPSRAFRAGEEYASKNGSRLRRPWTVWHLRTPHVVDPELFGREIVALLERLEPQADAIRRLRTQAEYCGFWVVYRTDAPSVSFDLPASLLVRLSALSDAITFSVMTACGESLLSQDQTVP